MRMINPSWLGVVAGYAFPWLVVRMAALVSGKQIMSTGDFKLLAAIGAWMGWQLVVPV